MERASPKESIAGGGRRKTNGSVSAECSSFILETVENAKKENKYVNTLKFSNVHDMNFDGIKMERKGNIVAIFVFFSHAS